MTTKVDLSQYYTAKEAARVLTERSGRPVRQNYVRNLAYYGIFHPLKISNRVHLYLKQEVDNYQVEDRGVKLERARQEKVTA